MRIVFEDHDSPKRVLSIEHGGEYVIYNPKYYNKTLYKYGEGIMYHYYYLNEFWSSLSSGEQLFIFNIYKDIMEDLDTVWVLSESIKKIRDKVTILLNFHNFDKMHDWVLHDSTITIQKSFKDKFDENIIKDCLGTREQTYIAEDYYELLTLSIMVRTVVPIWGEFILRHTEIGTVYRESVAYDLLLDSPIVDHKGWEKLEIGVRKLTEKDDKKFNHRIWTGISSLDVPIWLFKYMVVRKLGLTDISNTEEKANIVTAVHKFVTNRLQVNLDLSETIREKKNKSTVVQGQDKSTFENYTINNKLTPGEEIEIEFVSSNTENMLKQSAIEPYSLNFYNTELNGVPELMDNNLGEPQKILVQWMLARAISPNAINYVRRATLCRLMVATSTILTSLGFHFLSALSTSYPVVVNGEHMVSTLDSRTQVTKELLRDINEIYPYTKITGGVKSGYVENNLVCDSIDKLVNLIERNIWRITTTQLDKSLLVNDGLLVIPHDLRIEIAELIIYLGKRRYK